MRILNEYDIPCILATIGLFDVIAGAAGRPDVRGNALRGASRCRPYPASLPRRSTRTDRSALFRFGVTLRMPTARRAD
jgi:hypothetical protein